MDYKVIYQKANGEYIEKYRNTLPRYALGEITSMGWKYINILYNYKGKYYEHSEYKKLLHHR